LPGLQWGEEEIKVRIREAFVDKFGLKHDEVQRAREFYLRKLNIPGTVPAEPRRRFDYSQPKDIFDLCAYEYSNNHKGTFPFDTNDIGITNWNAGCYEDHVANNEMPNTPEDYDDGDDEA